MHRLGIVATAGILSAALSAFASPPPSPSPPQETKARKAPAEMESVTGTVKKYRAGKSIVIVGPDGKGRKLELDGTTRIDGPVARGQAVTAVWMTDSTGKPRVHAISTHPFTSVEAWNAASASPGAARSVVPPPPEPTPRETAIAPTATPHVPAEDAAATPSVRRTPLPNAP